MSNNNRENQGVSGMLSNLCAPAKLYGIVAIISVAGLLVSSQFLAALGLALADVLWVFILNWICSEGWSGLSWFLVLLPIIIVIIFIIMLLSGDSTALAALQVEMQKEASAERSRR